MNNDLKYTRCIQTPLIGEPCYMYGLYHDNKQIDPSLDHEYKDFLKSIGCWQVFLETITNKEEFKAKNLTPNELRELADKKEAEDLESVDLETDALEEWAIDSLFPAMKKVGLWDISIIGEDYSIKINLKDGE